MELRVIREPSVAGATLGVLFVDDHYFAFTLEDQIREVPGQPVESWKVFGETAIPSGRYAVTVSYVGAPFNRSLPHVNGVPGFTGILIHPGNAAADTEGCLLVGYSRANAFVGNATPACSDLQLKIEAALANGELVFITYENPPDRSASIWKSPPA